MYISYKKSLFSEGCPGGTSTFTDGDRLICYFTVTVTGNFVQGRDLCGQEITGADLAIIPNMAAQQFVVDLLNGYVYHACITINSW